MKTNDLRKTGAVGMDCLEIHETGSNAGFHEHDDEY
jgi:hypothetical protein